MPVLGSDICFCLYLHSSFDEEKKNLLQAIQFPTYSLEVKSQGHGIQKSITTIYKTTIFKETQWHLL